MDAVLGAWGLGAAIGALGRRSLLLRDRVGVPPMSARQRGAVEIFPLLLFEHVWMDERSFQDLVGPGVGCFSLSAEGRTLLLELRRQKVILTMSFTDVLQANLDQLHDSAQSLVGLRTLPECLEESRALWATFLGSPGAAAHPLREQELAGTREELRLLKRGLSHRETQQRAQHDVYDVAATTIVAAEVDAAICDWQMYRPFYDAIGTTGSILSRGPCGPGLRDLHDSLDLFLSAPNSMEPEHVFHVRESSAVAAFREYSRFLKEGASSYTLADFMKLRRDMLALAQGPFTRLNICPMIDHRQVALSEATIRDLVRSEVEAHLRVSEQRSHSPMIFQVIGKQVTITDVTQAQGSVTLGIGARADHVTIGAPAPRSDELTTLISDLSRLRTHMAAALEGMAERDRAIGAIADAERAASTRDQAGLFQSLGRAGHWAFDCARDIGVDISAAAITKALGL